MIIVHVVYKMKKEDRPGFIADILEKKVQERTEAEQGNVEYRFAIPLDCEDELVLSEKWESQEALEAHHHGEPIAVMKELKEIHGVVSTVVKFCAEQL